MASENEIDDPLYDLMNMYMILHDFPKLDDNLHDKLVEWVQTNIGCEFVLAHTIVGNRLYKKSMHIFGGPEYVFKPCTVLQPEEELAYQRWRHTNG